MALTWSVKVSYTTCTVYIFSVSYCLTVEEIHVAEDSTISTVEAETAHAVALLTYLYI
jgi:hypothetical protein